MAATSSSSPSSLSVRNSVLEAIGNTPVVKLRKLVTAEMADVVVKLEYDNPTASYKDRMALAMIEGAEASGKPRPGGNSESDVLWHWLDNFETVCIRSDASAATR